MPKGPRIFIENACYHIIARGNNRQQIFKDNSDYEKYLSLIKRYKKKHYPCIYGYCLMPNHVHIVMGIDKKSSLSSSMRGLQRAYSSHFAKKYGFFGHLWQGRFKSKIISKDRYLIDCVTYIESNPLRANIVSSIHEYPWSSYRERVLGVKLGIVDDISAIL